MQAAPGTSGTPGTSPDRAPSPLRSARDTLSAEVLSGELAPLELPPRFAKTADDYLAGLLDQATSSKPAGYALVAVGGYGRAELCPGSDLDVVLLHDKRRNFAQVANAIWYQVWDTGVRLDHSVRTPKEMLSVAGEDLRALLGLLDGRVISGDRAFAEGVLSKIAELWRAHHRKWLPELARATRERHRSFGELPYLLEPDLKESAGGLRDLEVMSLTARALPALADVIHPPSLDGAHDLLLGSRVALQARTGNQSDRLRLQEQDEVAAVLGYADADAFAAVLAEASREVMWASADGWRRIESVLRGPPGRSAGRETEVGRQILLRDGEIALGPDADPATDPALVLRAAAAAARHEVPMAVSCLDRLERERPELTVPWPDGMRDALVSLLEYGHAATPVIETLDRRRLFEWLLPEWSVVRHRPQRNAYHRFTVDRHLLEAVAEAASLLRNVERPDLLLIGALLHDIGKGHGHDHHERGAGLTAEVSQRLGLNSEEIDLVVFLVRNHLMMSQVAQKGDLDDHTTVEEFARTVGSIDRLKALYLLTYADMRAVAPKVYNNWRDMLLGDLYMRALKVLEQGGREAVDPARRLATVKAAVRATLLAAAAPDCDVSAFLEQMPDRYFFTVPEADIALHFDLMRSLGERPLVCRIRHFPELEFSEFIVVTRDQPGLFSMIAGALTANNLNILSARITTRTNGVAMDVFRVSHWMGAGSMAMEEDRWLRVEHDLERVITGQQDIAGLVAAAHHVQSAGRKFVRHVPTEVTVDNRTSEQFTVIDVFTQDRVGLLFAITHTLYRLGLLIHLARISTNADQALDVFYVSDRAGGKIEDLDRMRELRAALLEKVEENPGAGATA